MSKTLPIRLRPANEEDVPFVFNAWLKSYRNSLFGRTLTNTVFFTEHHKVLEKALKNSQVIIACNKDDASQIYGFICAGKTDGIFTLHYIYVKHSFRNMGIGKALLNAFEHDFDTAAVYTHHTRIAEKLAPKYNFIHHPYVLFNDYHINEVEDKSPSVEIVE